MVLDFVSVVWANVVVPAPEERLLIENSRVICWHFVITVLSAGVDIEDCNVRTTSTFSSPWPSSPGPVFEKSSRRLSNEFEQRISARWSSFWVGFLTGFPVAAISASCISSCLPICRHLPTERPSRTVSHSLEATASTSCAVSYRTRTSFSSLL